MKKVIEMLLMHSNLLTAGSDFNFNLILIA